MQYCIYQRLILRLALGSLAPTTLRPQSQRLAYKKQVEAFKLTFSLTLTFFGALCLLMPTSNILLVRAADAIFLFSMLYFYSTVTLREHILLVNGSSIRLWWFFHHYLSIALTGILLVCINPILALSNN
jgi:hypothetical protein